MSVLDLDKNADKIINAALHSVDPYHLILEQIAVKDKILYLPGNIVLDPEKYERLIVIGAGKGAAPMARAIEELLGSRLHGGAIIVKYEHLDELQNIILHEAGHPLPDENTIRFTNELVDLISELNENDCVIVLLTGGGSALMESLPDSITLTDLQHLSKALLACSAGIHEINCVRKHISRVKGGQLARLISPARCITLALSDVIGDDLSVIASGPTHSDKTTFADALDILAKYKIMERVPFSVVSHLEAGRSGTLPETPKPDNAVFDKVENIIIGSNRLALRSAARVATELGYNTMILTSMIDGEAREIAKMMAAIIREVQMTGMPAKRPACLLFGGEPTVHLTGQGKGGRNQELALAVAIAMRSVDQLYLFASCGSDGTDGPTDAAGAIVSVDTLKKAAVLAMDPVEYLTNNDAYNFFNPISGLIKTGPTRTNVMDIVLALIP